MNPLKTVLIVDGKPQVRRLVYHALRGRYRVLEAGDSQTALNLMKEEPVNLVLLDLNLSSGNQSPREGIRTHMHIRERQPEVPVVVVSGNDDSRLEEFLLGRGARKVLVKPVKGHELINVVRTLLEK